MRKSYLFIKVYLQLNLGSRCFKYIIDNAYNHQQNLKLKRFEIKTN